jgi:hypothetical protein
MRLPLQPRVTAREAHPAEGADIRAGAQGVATGHPALALGQLRG